MKNNLLPRKHNECSSSSAERTNDVDATIANILEGRVKPVPPPKPSEAVAPSSYRTAAGRWGQSADERHLSFAERKQAFLENARRRYLEKMSGEEIRVV